MAELAVPYVAAATEMYAALRTMQSAQRSGIVSLSTRGLVLHTADELLDQIHLGLEKHHTATSTLQELDPRFPGIDIPSARPPNFVGTSGERRALNAWLAEIGARYAIVGIKSNTAEIITAQSDFGDLLLKVPVMCHCSNDRTHIWRPSDVSGGKCPVCGTDVVCA